MKRIVFIISMIPLFLYSQNPMGNIYIALYDSMGNQIIFHNTPGLLEGYSYGYTNRISDTTNQYAITSYRKHSNSTKIKKELALEKPAEYPYIILYTGFGGDFQLVIERQNNQNGYTADTMTLNLIATCNNGFWLDVVFQPGFHEILVCDTTKIPWSGRPEGFRYKPLEEQYPKKNGTYDITPKQWKRKNED